jgi:two-component system sensor histidine kinase TctE
MRTVLFDQTEALFFAVLRPDGSLLAGHTGLHTDPLGESKGPTFQSLDYQNRSLRRVMIHRQQPAEFYVVMAQTTMSRDRLIQRLLVFSIAPQILLLIFLATWLQRAIEEDLEPLAALEKGLGQRDARDLTPVSVSASTRDIQRLGQAINALLGRIADSVRAQREFSGNVAHELRTPLAGIRALADYGLLQNEPRIWREQLEGIVQSQERASHLVDQLLALALADETQQTLEQTPIAIDALVREAVLRFLPRADVTGVDLGANDAEKTIVVLGNVALDNAFRYGRAQEEPSRITVSLKENLQSVILSVVDNGPGVSSAHLQKLSKRWAQGAAGEALKEGSGLGLAIVKSYVNLMDAKLHMGNETPHGLRVSVTFAKL